MEQKNLKIDRFRRFFGLLDYRGKIPNAIASAAN